MQAGPAGPLLPAGAVLIGGSSPSGPTLPFTHGRDGPGGDTGPFHENLVKCATESSVTYW